MNFGHIVQKKKQTVNYAPNEYQTQTIHTKHVFCNSGSNELVNRTYTISLCGYIPNLASFAYLQQNKPTDEVHPKCHPEKKSKVKDKIE